jgi:hypothetical protein
MGAMKEVIGMEMLLGVVVVALSVLMTLGLLLIYDRI